MVFVTDSVTRAAVALLVVSVLLVLLGIAIPKLLIPEVPGGVELGSPEAVRYVEARVGNAGGFGQKAARMQISIVDRRPDPTGCDRGYPEPVTGTFTVRTYTLWGIPLETWEVSCNAERLVAGPFGTSIR